jgi:hypothetical protein
MSRNQIKDDAHPAFFRFLEKPFKVCIGAISRSDTVIIRYVISRVLKRRYKAGIQPDCVTTKLFDIVEFADDAGNIADAVTVSIKKALRIDFVKEGAVKPGRQAAYHVALSPVINAISIDT